MKRQELIDYTIWLVKKLERGDTPAWLVDNYLRSINSTPTKINNSEVCKVCGADILTDVIGNKYCGSWRCTVIQKNKR